jgi:hypothetical protein
MPTKSKRRERASIAWQASLRGDPLSGGVHIPVHSWGAPPGTGAGQPPATDPSEALVPHVDLDKIDVIDRGPPLWSDVFTRDEEGNWVNTGRPDRSDEAKDDGSDLPEGPSDEEADAASSGPREVRTVFDWQLGDDPFGEDDAGNDDDDD